MSCAQASVELGEPLEGTAAVARTWLLVEQPGPWGAKALTASHLDPEAGRALDRAASGTGVRVALVRRPGRHADLHRPARRRVLLAHTSPGGAWLRTADIADPAGLAALDFAALGAPDAAEPLSFGTAYHGPPVVAVCTNGRRDRCCALYGRPLAAELAASGSLDVWEITHLGGHRFAPTMVVLPHGYAYGRVDGAHAKRIAEAAQSGRVVPDGCRGRSTWERPGQAAELAVRRLTGEEDADALTVGAAVERTDTGTASGGAGPVWRVPVVHRDGRSWQVAVARTASEPPRPESCGAALGTPARMEVTGIEPAAAGRALPYR